MLLGTNVNLGRLDESVSIISDNSKLEWVNNSKFLWVELDEN